MLNALLISLSLAQAPLSTQEMVKLGEALALRGDGKKAQVQLEKALAAEGDGALDGKTRARAERALGLALLQQRKGKDAVGHLETSATLDGSVEKTWLYLGLAKDQVGDTKGSIQAYRDGAKALPKSISLQHELGMALLSAGLNVEGATVLDKAAAKAEHNGELMADAAYGLSLVGRFQDAREYAMRAVEMSPDSPDALYTLGMSELGLGKGKEAAAAFAEAIDSDETHVPALFQLGLLLQAQGDDKGAAKRLTTVLRVDPDHTRAKAHLGVSLVRLAGAKAEPRAEGLLRDAVAADPSLAIAWATLGDVEARNGKIKDASASLKKALKLKAEPAWQKRLDGLKNVKEGTPAP